MEGMTQGKSSRGGDGGGGSCSGQNAIVDPAPHSGKIRGRESGYFDPEYRSERKDDVVSAGRHVCYRDMFVWIHNFMGLVKNRSEEELRSMNIQAFCDGALIGYSTEVGELQKDLLRDATMEWWRQVFAKRFKEEGLEAQYTLDLCSYSTQEARRGRTPHSNAQEIIRCTRHCPSQLPPHLSVT